MGRAGTTHLIFLLAISLMLAGHSRAEPFQCQELRSVIPDCQCAARVVDGQEINSQVVINCRNTQLLSLPTITRSSNHVIYEMTLAKNSIQTLPEDGFSGLKIQRLDLTENRLTTINTLAFRGLETELQELYLGAEVGTSIPPPLASMTNLTALNTLHLEHFKFANNDIVSGGLNRLTSLTSLTLAHNNVSYIAETALPTGLTSLTLDDQDLTSLPTDLLQNLGQLERLAVTNTLVSAIYNQAFSANTRLTSLDISYNRINVLYTDCFSGITSSLRTLSLRNNPLSSVTDLGEIKKLTALTSLQLSDITLSSVPQGADFLLNKPSLLSLNLDGNALSTLGPDVFTDLGALTSLDLSRNQLAGSGMDDQAFAGLSSLLYLDLGHQTMATGQSLTLPKSLASLSSLQTLMLSSTAMSQSTLWQRIGPITSLRNLHLDHTSLTTVPDYALQNLTQLKEVHLDNNGLTGLTQEMLAGPRGLTKLTVNNNQVSTLSSCVFYGFPLSPPLSVELAGNPLHCDCKLSWLLEEYKAGRVPLTGTETCASPPEHANAFLIALEPTDLTCVSTSTDSPCLELYTTPKPSVTTTLPTPEVGLTITNVSATSISMSWTVENLPGLTHFQIQHMDLSISQPKWSGQIGASKRAFQVEGLREATTYSVCLFAYSSPPATTQQACTTRTTASGGGETDQQKDDESSNTGIIVGTVVGVVVLLAIIAAIVYLLFLRKRTSKDVPAQPHVFAASELPGMGATSRQFTRPKEKQQPKVGRALDENIQVTVISDGHTGPSSPRDRQSVGSYQFLDEKHPNPNPHMVPKGSSDYSNDVDSRPLPSAPEGSMGGYYNGGIPVEKDPSQHVYNQIDH